MVFFGAIEVFIIDIKMQFMEFNPKFCTEDAILIHFNH